MVIHGCFFQSISSIYHPCYVFSSPCYSAQVIWPTQWQCPLDRGPGQPKCLYDIGYGIPDMLLECPAWRMSLPRNLDASGHGDTPCGLTCKGNGLTASFFDNQYWVIKLFQLRGVDYYLTENIIAKAYGSFLTVLNQRLSYHGSKLLVIAAEEPSNIPDVLLPSV